MNDKPLEVKRSTSPAHLMPVDVNDTWQAFRHEMERLFDRFTNGVESFSLKPFANIERLWPRGGDGFACLAMDVTEDDKSYTITAELPGLDEKNIDVSLSDDMLVIKGEKQQEKEEKGKNRYVAERSYGAFQRTFALPKDAEADKVKAQFTKGVLTVTLPKSAQAQNIRKVEVKAA